MSVIFISVGSNINAKKNLRRCEKNISKHLVALKISEVYRTTAIGPFTQQDDYLNAVFKGETKSTLDEIYDLCKKIEKSQGRIRTEDPYAPRSLDLDLLLFDMKINPPPRELPHPQILTQAFVLKPLCDLVPDLIHPKTKKTLSQHLQNMDLQGIRKISFSWDSPE